MPQLRVVEPAAQRADLEQNAGDMVTELRRVFDSGVTRPLAWRMRQLAGLERFLIDREQDIFDALQSDLGKPALEAYTADVGFVLAELKYTKRHLKGWLKPERVPTTAVALPGRSEIHRDPLGVVLIIGPWNYPLHLLLAPLLGAVAAGNCAVLKPSELAPATSRLVARWLPKYVDAEAIRVVEGGVPETTALLKQRWDYIFYTGNGNVGRIVMEAAAQHLTPVTLELGGKSPCIVDRDADLDVAARRIVFGKFYNAGQTCVAPDYVLVVDEVHDALVNRLASTIRDYYGDNPEQSPDFARVINDRHFARLMKLMGSGEVVTGGKADGSARYIAPTVLKHVQEDAPVMQEEIFGPILPVISVPHVDAAVAFVNRRPKALALYLFAKDKATHRRVIEQTTSGGATINHVWIHLGVPSLPFGGVGDSGMGAYHGRASFETFSHRRAVLTKPSWFDPPILYPPYSARKLSWIRRLV